MKQKRKAFAPRKMRANNKPTQCMPPVCVMCLRTSAGKTKVVHGADDVCPQQAKIDAAKAKLRAKRAAASPPSALMLSGTTADIDTHEKRHAIASEVMEFIEEAQP